MMNVNGWQRIGVIASVIWILCAWVHTFDSEIDSASKGIAAIHVVCDSELAGKSGDAWKKGFDECNKQATDSIAEAMTNARLSATVVGLVPVPLGWGFTYLILFLVRWVKRGFIRPI